MKDLLEFFRQHPEIETTFSSTCRQCGFDYTKLGNGQYHDCTTGEIKNMVFPEHMKAEAEKHVDELMKDLKVKE